MSFSDENVPQAHPRPQFSLKGLLKAVFYCCVALGMSSLFLAALSDPREVSRQSQCANNLRSIGLALLQYHDDFGCFPAPSIADQAGTPMHSWRVAIAPYLDEPFCRTFREHYDFNEPWNSLANKKAAHVLDGAWNPYLCPSAGQPRGAAFTNYVMVVGATTACRTGEWMSLDRVNDGSRHTILVAEIANSDILWTEPRDLSFDEMSFQINDESKPAVSSHHHHQGHGLAAVLLADGSVKFLDEATKPEELKAMLTSPAED